ncbi:MAG: GNAT family N-acetyltransferase [Chloroflexi bacterium]|nr:GNAT family N-acetyltransferase [Chloroflexota bacterium]
MMIVKLARAHAAAAARLHIAGQPGTFLTSLGPDVLTVLYRVLPESATGFGYVALADHPIQSPTDSSHSSPITHHSSLVTGFVSATSNVGRLFAEMGTRRIHQFLPPLCARFVRQPTLIFRSLQTLLYPFLAAQDQGKGSDAAAELLSIMVAPEARAQGLGAQLLQALLVECALRQIRWLDVTVDANNAGARRFYERHQFRLTHQFNLYGRAMCGYQRAIAPVSGREVSSEN